jgi:adenosylmethionine-8-amino-7-oxononanoate aminotransferase
VRAAFEGPGVAFEHVFTFGGHPVSAAAGLAVLDIWEREQLTERAAGLEAVFTAALDRLREHPFVGDVRVTGLMAGIEFVADRETREPFDPWMKFGTRVREAGLRNGIVTYPGSGMADGARGDIISLYPPLIVTEADIDEIAERLEATFLEVERDLGT